jgi:murein DD-endopeptidase MepM/ murein hydrolase activator NlpD
LIARDTLSATPSGARELPRPFAGRLALADEPAPARRSPRTTAIRPAPRREPAAIAPTATAAMAAPLTALLPPAGVLTSRFSRNRRHPVLGIRRPHLGVDLRAPYGTPILAPSAGVVRRVAREAGFGLLIEVDHGGGVLTRYAHCSRALVREGQQVARGERIAAVGRSGVASGPHLHYEVSVDGRSVDPLTFAFADWAAVPDSIAIPDPTQP